MKRPRGVGRTSRARRHGRECLYELQQGRHCLRAEGLDHAVHTHANIQSTTNLNFGGSIVIGLDDQLDLGPLGKILIRCDANGSLNFGIRNKIAFATFQAGLQFEAWQVNTGLLTLDVDGRALEKIADTLLAELKKVFVDGLLKDVQRFVDWAKRGLLEGVASVSRSPGS